MAEKYTKAIYLQTELDEKKFEEVQNKFKDLKENFGIQSAELANRMASDFTKYFNQVNKVAEMEKQYKELQNKAMTTGAKEWQLVAKAFELQLQVEEEKLSKLQRAIGQTDKELDEKISEKQESDFGKSFKGVFKGKYGLGEDETYGQRFGQKAGQAITKLFDKSLEKMSEIFKSAWAELSNMLSYSKLSDSSTRNLVFQYGFSASQAYGYSKAMELTGLKSEEDLYYMKPQERQRFISKLTDYADRYNKLEENGFFETLQEFNWEMNDLKEDLKMTVVDFFINNKDEIKTFLKITTEAIVKIMELVLWLSKGFGKSPATVDSIVEGAGGKKTSIVINNTYNGTNSAEVWTQEQYKNSLTQVVHALEN